MPVQMVTPGQSFITSNAQFIWEQDMDAAELRATQAPFKERYKSDPKAALITLQAKGSIDNEGIACKLETGRALAVAGLHPAAGGSGLELCSGDMLLEAPVACAEIRLRFDVETSAPQDKLDLLLKLTERYCVVYQTIKNGPRVSVTMQRL